MKTLFQLMAIFVSIFILSMSCQEKTSAHFLQEKAAEREQFETLLKDSLLQNSFLNTTKEEVTE